MMAVVTLESRMAVNARSYALRTASLSDSPRSCSSRRRSKISTFASTAMPIVSTSAAMPGRVNVAPIIADTPRMMIRLKISPNTATTPARW